MDALRKDFSQKSSPGQPARIESVPIAAHPEERDSDRLAVPLERAERLRLRLAVEQYVERRHLVPPLSMEELTAHATAIGQAAQADPAYHSYLMVLLSNRVWRDTIAAVPYDRRILMLPQCLRTRGVCQAPMDEMGLLCEECGQCATGDLQAEAENLGYVVLIAEGTTVVTKLLEQGRVDAVIGVSCLSTLERSFPYMAADAIPGLAIPLYQTGCDSTRTDFDWVREAIRLRSEEGWAGRLDIDELRTQIRNWFETGELDALLHPSHTQTERIAIEWLRKGGKRWRPLLAVCVYKALLGVETPVPESTRRLAVAVECFHKASLVHDDIEDDDAVRYGEVTLHRRDGIPVALNVGDFLLGEGYRQIAESGMPSGQIEQLMRVAVLGHRTLCLGQGEELCWMRAPHPLTPREVIEIFRLKTAPAFDVALQLGAIAAGADSEVCQVLKRFSDALGIAFQIRDDLDDFHSEAGDGDAHAMRPSILFALAYEQAAPVGRQLIEAVWCAGKTDRAVYEQFLDQIRELAVEEKARQLLEHFKNEAVRSLSPLTNAHLKSLLRRVVGKILGRAC
jgi:geranylgeranyl pyrophosphate synthase